MISIYVMSTTTIRNEDGSMMNVATDKSKRSQERHYHVIAHSFEDALEAMDQITGVVVDSVTRTSDVVVLSNNL